jgi:hypothetical protein
MTHAYRVLLATIGGLVLTVAGMSFVNSVASGSTPTSFDSGTASCKTDSLGYCNGPTLPFAPNAVAITVQAPVGGPSQATAQLTSGSFRARFFQPAGGAASAATVTYSYVATRGTTVTPTPTLTPTLTPTPKPTQTPTQTPTPGSTGTVMSNAFVTGYGWPDNSPPGNVTSGLSGHAGGTGTYADPITLAVGYVGNTPDYPYRTKFYIPNVRRYFIVGDTCAACHSKPSGASVWVDMWAGGNGSDNAGVLACENSVTGNTTIILNPDANRPVVSGPLFNGSCTAQFGG